MTDIAELEIVIEPGQSERDLEALDRRIRDLIRDHDRLEDSVDDLNDNFRSLSGVVKLLGAALAGIALTELVTGFINTARESERLNAQLLTATGSASAAARAYAELTEFAVSTPFQMNQAIEGFAKLQNLGLDPTIEALTSFGNTSVAMGKELNDMIEAVADASTFEFERLKEFGIKSSQQGDSVIFTFRGVKTEIEKDAKAIVGYLTDIGNVEFAGAMDAQMQGVSGAMANLNAATSSLSSVFVEALTPAFSAAINMIAKFIEKVSDATREVLEFFGVIRSDEIKELESELKKVNELWISHAAVVRIAAQGTYVQAGALEESRNRVLELQKESAELTQRIKDLQPPLEVTANKATVTANALGGSESGSVASGARQANEELKALLETSKRLANIREGLAEVVGGSLADRLGQEIDTGQIAEIENKLENMGKKASLNFSGAFWGIFNNEAGLALESLISTFQNWGQQIAQSDIFQPMFEKLSAGMSGALGKGLSAALGGFGIGATASGFAGGGTAGLLAGLAGGALTGGLATGNLLGALIGGAAGGLGSLLTGGSGQNRYGFSVSGGLGGLRGAGGPGQGDFSQFIEFLNQLESSIARTFNPQQLSEITRELNNFASAEIRMKEGGFDAQAALGLVNERMERIVREMGPGFLRLFRQMETGTAQSMERAIQSLLAVDRAMEAFGLRIRDATALLDEAAAFGESYADTLTRIASAQATLEQALYSEEERQQRTLDAATGRIEEFNREMRLFGDVAIDTREELKSYVDSLDLSTDAGRKAYLQIVDLADAFLTLFNSLSTIEQATDAVQDVVEDTASTFWDASRLIADLNRLQLQYVDFLYKIEDAINGITKAIPSWELSYRRFLETTVDFDAASRSGAPLEMRKTLFDRAFGQFQQAYSQYLGTLQSDLQSQISSIQERYQRLGELESNRLSQQEEGLREQLSLTQSWASTLSNVSGIIQSLQLGSQSPFGAGGQYAIGQAGLASLRGQYARASGANRAALGGDLAQLLQAQLGLGGALFPQGSSQYLREYNAIIAELTGIEREAASEAARQTQIEAQIQQLQVQQTDSLARIDDRMQAEIDAATRRHDREVQALNRYAETIYQEFGRIGQQLYQEMVDARLQQAAQEQEAREIQQNQLAVLMQIRDGFIAAGLLSPQAMARSQAKVQPYV